MSHGRLYDWLQEAQAETTEFLDDVLEFFQENDCERAEEFEEWKASKDNSLPNQRGQD